MTKMKRYQSVFFTSLIGLSLLVALLPSCNQTKKQEKGVSQQEVNVYTHRHYEADQKLFSDFTKETGIKVNVVNASADELMLKMVNEGSKSPADVLITVDAGRLQRAKEKGLFQSVSAEKLLSNIPAYLRDVDNQWFGLTKRARIVVYKKDMPPANLALSYQDLADDSWKGKVLVRSSSNIYNQSLLAGIIANSGTEAAKAWASGLVSNMARSPKGNDRDQIKAMVAGQGEVAIVNSYYVGKMINSKDPSEVEVANQIAVLFPGQQAEGTHVNVSGAGVARYAPNKENAIKFITYLSDVEAQQVFSEANYEYPVNPRVKPSLLLQSWGSFKEDTVSISKLGELNKKAVLIFDEVGWK